MADNSFEQYNPTPEDFVLVQKDERIFDKEFETKPTGYFKDAFIRFRKNRTNLIATFILATMILLAIFVPMLTTKNYRTLNTQLAYLPPRVPLLNRLGIADGKMDYDEQVVDLSTYDPVTNVGYPAGIYPQFIEEGSLELYKNACTNRIAECVGGQSLLQLNASATSTGIQSTPVTFVEANAPTVTVDVVEFTGADASLQIFVNKGENILIGEITTPGKHTFPIYDNVELEEDEESFASRVILMLTSENTEEITTVLLESVVVNDSEGVVLNDSGFPLSNYQQVLSRNGGYSRRNAEILMASFVYDKYEAAYFEVEERGLPSAEYYELIENPACVGVEDPDNPDGLIFPEGCAIKRMVRQNEKIPGPDGKLHYSYHVFLDYRLYNGLDELPFFQFGTYGSGYDYFALVWYGLRTSLIIGVLVAFINITIGVIYGSIEGYYGGTVDLLMERFGEVIGRIPFLVWLALFVVIFGSGPLTLILLLTITGWLGIASTTRAQFYRYKGREYVLASRTLGAKDSRLIFRHILPNGIGTIITASILMIPGVIFTESTISYLGYGIGHGQSFNLFGIIELTGVSIGVLLADGRAQIMTNPHLIFFPALIISLLMISFNMFGNALRDAFNPSLRGSE